MLTLPTRDHANIMSEFSSVFQGSFKGVSTKISDISSSFKRVSRVFERSLKGV